MFIGSIVALVTPMYEDGSIDKKSLAELVEWHIASRTDALVVAGTTGESPTLTPEEQKALITLVVKQVRKRIPVIAGAGTNATLTTLQLAQNAQAADADACLIVTPYYNKPTQKGLYQHYKLIAENTALPMILYNVPSRTACDLLPETLEHLATFPNIIGIKEATGDLERAAEILKRCGHRFALYSGDDATALDLMLLGGQGVISVTANIVPERMHALCQAALRKERAQAESINHQLALLHKRLFLESSPIPAKWALHHMGKIASGIRLPLLTLDPKYHQALYEAMQSAGVE